MAGNESMAAILTTVVNALNGMKKDLALLEGKLGKDKEHGKAANAMLTAYKAFGEKAAALQKKMKG